MEWICFGGLAAKRVRRLAVKIVSNLSSPAVKIRPDGISCGGSRMFSSPSCETPTASAWKTKLFGLQLRKLKSTEDFHRVFLQNLTVCVLQFDLEKLHRFGASSPLLRVTVKSEGSSWNSAAPSTVWMKEGDFIWPADFSETRSLLLWAQTPTSLNGGCYWFVGFAAIITSDQEFKLQSHESRRTLNVCRKKWKTFLPLQTGVVETVDAAESHVTQSETKMV